MCRSTYMLKYGMTFSIAPSLAACLLTSCLVVPLVMCHGVGPAQAGSAAEWNWVGRKGSMKEGFQSVRNKILTWLINSCQCASQTVVYRCYMMSTVKHAAT